LAALTISRLLDDGSAMTFSSRLMIACLTWGDIGHRSMIALASSLVSRTDID